VSSERGKELHFSDNGGKNKSLLARKVGGRTLIQTTMQLSKKTNESHDLQARTKEEDTKGKRRSRKNGKGLLGKAIERG